MPYLTQIRLRMTINTDFQYNFNTILMTMYTSKNLLYILQFNVPKIVYVNVLKFIL
jgi:hypothetical protein